MLKIGGWTIDDDAVDVWKKQMIRSEWAEEVPTRQRVLETLGERECRGLKPLPVSENGFISVPWPKMTKEVCILVRVWEVVTDETWDDFTSIPAKSEDDEIFSAFESDGLKLGEWVTVPDPFEDEEACGPGEN